MTVNAGTGTPSPRDGIEAAKRMTDALADFAAELKKLSARDRRSRLYLRILAVSFTIDIILTVAFGFLALQTNNNSHAIHDSQIVACESNNARLAKQESAIDAILQPAENLSPAQHAAAEKYFVQARAKIAVAWHARDCAQAYKLP